MVFLGGVASELEDSGAGLLLIPTSESREEGARVVRAAAVDGFLVYSVPTGDPRLVAALTVASRRSRSTNRWRSRPWIGIDDRAAAREAARHLVELGHERVAVLGFPEFALDDERLPYDVTHERFAGYREGLGDVWDPELVMRAVGNRPETGRRAVEELLRLAPRPTAVLAMADALAAGCSGAAEQGVAVPERCRWSASTTCRSRPHRPAADDDLAATEEKGRLVARGCSTAGERLPARAEAHAAAGTAGGARLDRAAAQRLAEQILLGRPAQRGRARSSAVT